jgi:hypothetical protein
MQRILTGVFSAALMIGAAAAQGNNPSTSPAPEPESSTPAPSQGQQRQTAEPQMPVTQGAATKADSAEGPNAAHAGPATRIAPGSVIPAALAKTVDAKKVKVGDQVLAKVTQDLKSNNGQVIMPKDTEMMGRVTQAQPRNKEQKESEVGIAFDRVVMKNGITMTMPMSIQAVIGPENNMPQGNQNNTAGGTETPGPTGTPAGTRPGMGGSSPVPSPSTPSEMPSESQGSTRTRPPITASTQGVIGISNLSLESNASNPAQGSLLTSEKNNVKIESGTMLLLRVDQ